MKQLLNNNLIKMKTAKKIIVSVVGLLFVIFLFIYREYNLKKNAEIRQNQEQRASSGSETVCIDEYKPVCGEDGKTYSNRCFAEKIQSVNVKYDGKCKEENLENTGNEIGEDNLGSTGSAESSTGTEIPLPKVIEEPKPTTDYYKNLRGQCGADSSCCLASVDNMENGGFKEAVDGKCPAGYEADMLKCEDTYKWCIKSTKTVYPSSSETASSTGKTQSYFNQNYNYGFSLPYNTFFSGYGKQGDADHAVGISSGSGVTDFKDNSVKVFFYKGKILTKLQFSSSSRYLDPETGDTYINLNGNTVVIKSEAGNEKIVRMIIDTIYAK